MLLQNLPESGALAQQFQAAASQRNHPRPQIQAPGQLTRFDHRQIGNHGDGITVNKVKDAMTSRIHARNKGGPGNGAQWRHGGLKRLEVAFGDEPLEMG